MHGGENTLTGVTEGETAGKPYPAENSQVKEDHLLTALWKALADVSMHSWRAPKE